MLELVLSLSHTRSVCTIEALRTREENKTIGDCDMRNKAQTLHINTVEHNSTFTISKVSK